MISLRVFLEENHHLLEPQFSEDCARKQAEVFFIFFLTFFSLFSLIVYLVRFYTNNKRHFF